MYLIPFLFHQAFGSCFFRVFSSTMDSTVEVSSSSQIPSISTPTGGSDSFALLIIRHKLNGHNYLQWSHLVMMFICGQGNDDYLTGVAPKWKIDDPMYKVWKTENNMVMLWLINSITNEVGENFILYETTQEIWTATKETYSDMEDAVKTFEIEEILYDFRQGDLTVTQYFSLLTRYWQQLDMYATTTWECQTDIGKYKKIIEKK